MLFSYRQSECNSSVCVGGNTGKSLNWGKDRCGVCGGNNKCVDCVGVVRGKNETDSCGECLDPKLDRLQFNKCPKILDVDVKAITGDESTQMCLTIAAPKKIIECYLQRENERYFFYSLFKKEIPTLNSLYHLFDVGSILKILFAPKGCIVLKLIHM